MTTDNHDDDHHKTSDFVNKKWTVIFLNKKVSRSLVTKKTKARKLVTITAMLLWPRLRLRNGVAFSV